MDLRPGTTPIIFLSNFIAAKMENKNPSGSIKDRIVETELNTLKNDGVISRKSVLVSVLNGEFAVSFAYFCAKKGFKCIIICSKLINKNHLSLCKMFGAEIHFSESESYKSMLKLKEELIKKAPENVYVDFYNRHALKKLYHISFCQELKLQVQSAQKNIKNVFLFSESCVLAESIKDSFPSALLYNVKISNGFFNFNGQKRNIVNNLNILAEDEPSKNLFEKQININFDKVVENIKDVSKKSGLLMDYRTSACYLSAKDYVCYNNDVNLIVFYENGERYVEEILSL